MDNLNVLANENNQVNAMMNPPQVCARCKSDNTKFCYYNNYSVSQPRYFCKNCRRYWTLGGALRDVPIGGKSRKRARVDQAPVCGMVFADIQQVNHQPFSYVQENNEFVGSFGASSPFAAAVGMVSNVHPTRSFPPNHGLDFHDGSFEQDYYDVGSESSLTNQSFGGYVDNHNGYHMDQVDQHNWNQSFNNTTNMNHNASTSGSIGSDMNMNGDNKKNRYKTQ